MRRNTTLALFASVLATFAPVTIDAAGPATYTFQNGANGYAGAADVSINNQYAQYNGGNGVATVNSPNMACYNITGNDAYSMKYLLRFGNLPIPAKTPVVSASLTLVADSFVSGGSITGFYLKNAWNPTAGNLGWLHRDTSADWAGAGASSAGTDTVAGKSFAFPALASVGVQTVTMALDPAMVQTWIDTPQANQGIMLVNNNDGQVVRLLSTFAEQNRRPILTVVVANAVGVQVSVNPQTITLTPGSTRGFSATVIGSANTAVNWSATGGTITPAGLFTAGTAQGAFKVKAIPVADPTRSASATVTISPPVNISVSPQSAALVVGQTRQFSATVTGTSNTAVTWQATGGTISASGLFTAGNVAGSYTVTAQSSQDPAKTASVGVSISAAPPVTISVAPLNPVLYPNGTLQFTATLANAANTAVTWAVSGGQISAGGLYTAASAAGSFTVTATSVQDPTKSASITVAVVTPVNSAHPRILLDNTTLSTLRGRAQAHTGEWTALKTECDSYVGGSVLFPGQNGYPNRPTVGEGYQGSSYVDAMMPLGLCYQTTLVSDPASAAQYGAKGVAILLAMSDPAYFTVAGRPIWRRDDGYGIRNFVFAMGIGYDWFYPLLTQAHKTQLQVAMQNWIEGYETFGFEYPYPNGNYYSGYYGAKVMAALAVEGDSPVGDAWWLDWYNIQHLQRVVPSYAVNLAGGGWSEGIAQYGILSMFNMTLPTLAVKTAKGLDLIHGTQPNGAQPYPYPLDNARYLMHFTWPSRDMTDDRGELYNTDSVELWPGTPSLYLYRYYAGFLSMWADPLAPAMHKYARDAKTALNAKGAGTPVRWIDFIFWDDTAPDTDYSTLPASYLAPGIGGVSARSDWSAGATFMSFTSGPYVNYPGAAHEHFDKGSPAFQRASNPLLVNPTAWITHEPAGSPGWTATFEDFDSNYLLNEAYGNRRLYNSFQVRKTDASGRSVDRYGQWGALRTDGARTGVGRFEDGGSYVLSVGTYLEDMYRPLASACGGTAAITSWSRQILYLRPSRFVVYDRTAICDSSLDQLMAFHFPTNPVEVAGGALGVRRFDVTNGQFAGSMSVVLPANAAIATTDKVNPNPVVWNKLWRSEVRPTDTAATTRRWLTVFDLSASSAQVAAASPVTIGSGPVLGVMLESAAGNEVSIFGTAPFGTAIAGSFSYSVAAAQTRHVITDLAPSTGYTVSVVASGSSHIVTVTPGGPRQASANGVLTFVITPGGALQP